MRTVPRSLSFLAVALLLLFARGLEAAPLRPPAGENPPIQISLDKDKLGADTDRFNKLRDGSRPIVEGAETEKNRELIAKAARWYAFRHTLPDVYENKLDDNLKLFNVLKQANVQLLLKDTGEKKEIKPEQEPFLKEYSKEFINCLREVLAKNPTLVVRVNTARLLAAVATAGQEEVADTCLDLINDPQENGGVKLWAFRALKELFAQGTPGKSIVNDPAREKNCILADASAEEAEGHRYVRREAVRALALTRYPIVPGAPPGSGQTALTLLRVMRKEGLTPTSSLGEQTEAALGLCHMQAQLTPAYQPDYAGRHVGDFLVDFLSQYNAQRAAAVGTGFPFRTSAARLSDGLDELKGQIKAPGEAGAFLGELAVKGKEALKPAEAGKDNASPEALDAWLKGKKIPSDTLYKGIATSILKTGG
jgi:hypothetical protein